MICCTRLYGLSCVFSSFTHFLPLRDSCSFAQASGLIKKQIAKAIKDGIETGLGLLDAQLISVRDRMAEADQAQVGQETKQSKLNVLGEVSWFFLSFPFKSPPFF